MKIWNRIKEEIPFDKVILFVLGWIIAFDVIGGTFIPIAYGKGCGWFAVPNLIVDLLLIRHIVKEIKRNGGVH